MEFLSLSFIPPAREAHRSVTITGDVTVAGGLHGTLYYEQAATIRGGG